MPFYSVVIPVYNRAHSLRDCLLSVLVQTEQDFEIIVVDDGSTDDPKAVIAALGDPRVLYVRQNNHGGAAARNRGIEEAHGRFVAFLDSDDTFLPEHLATMRPLVESFSNTVAYARMIVERGGGRQMLKPPRGIRPGEHMATYLLCDRGFVPTITLVVPREIAMQVRYDENMPFAQDTDFAIRLYLSGCEFVMSDAPGAIYRDEPHPGRVSSGRKGIRLVDWLERMRPLIPEKAYYGARGWMIAKGMATMNRPAALKLYISAVRRRCYSFRIALVVFLQIFLPDSFYRALADRLIGWFRGAVWSRAERGV